GAMTLVGTTTNLLINSFMLDRGMPGLRLFDLLPVGILLLAGCGLFMVLAYPTLIRTRPSDVETASDYFVEATVKAGSTLIGGTVESNGLRNLGHLFLTEIVRGEHLIAPVEPEEVVSEGDILVFAGDVTRLDLLARFNGLQTHCQHDDLPLDNLVEVVVATESTLARRTLRDVDFRSQFDAAVVEVRRGSERLGGSIGNIRIEVGDTLVLVVGKDFEKRNNLVRNFVIVSRRELQKFVDPRKAWLSMAGFVAVIILAAFGVLGFLKGLLILLAAFLFLGLAKVPELRRNMPYSIILIIGSALIISEVMISSGTARLLASWMLAGADHWGPHAALAMMLVVTWLLTEMMSNNAAAALA
ncbi:MAG: SLC13 family permease, partial [Candidatus Accumulibacter sp.]|nr:SLC13 family permease [Accumulibacter sp.]